MPRNTAGLRRGGPGRVKGVPNKTTRDIRDWARSVLEDRKVRENTLNRARDGELPPGILVELMHYAYGKPKDTLDIHMPRPVVLDLVTERDDAGDTD